MTNPYQPKADSVSQAEAVPPGKLPKRAALIFIFITVLLDVLSLGVTIPVLPKLIEEFRSGDTASAAAYVGMFMGVWALMQFLFSPVLGALSDQFGRRRVILISCFGLGLDYILMALAPNLVWLFVGRVLSGITAASFSTAGAYIADVTPPEKRAASYGMIGAAWGIGFIVGPAVGGFLGDYGLRIPLWVAAGLTLINATYGYFILPESLTLENRSKFSWRKANPLGSLKLLRSHPELLGLASVLLIYQIAHQVFPSVFVLYAGHRYGWGPQTVGYTLTAVGIMSVLMQGFIVRRTASKLGEWRMLFIALSFGAAGYAIYGVAGSGWVFWTAIPVFSLVGYFSPAIQGLMTRRVSASEQGQLQGANSSLMGIAGMAGPVIFSSIFSAGIREGAAVQLPGAPFILATILHVVAIAVALCIMPRKGTSPGDS
ncbi:MAG: TCR/Tet family MFS transporter [Pirellulaceae bacterium]